MAENEHLEWVFDSLVGFLKGPVWEAAVLTFIEQKSVVFDPEEGDENEYQKLHEEYKRLVDTMLSSHMDDLGITANQFEQACGETNKNIHSQFRKTLFEQIWAADDYEIFKRMMMQKNVELQLLALDLLAHQFGLLPESFLPDEDYEPSQGEKSVMEAVIKRYIEESSEPCADPPSQEKDAINVTKARLEAERKRGKQLMEKAMESSLLDSSFAEEVVPLEITKSSQVSPVEAELRQQYLRQQRDRLLALKRQEREKRLKNYEGTSSRPKSCRAAQRAVEETSEPSTVDPNVLAFRQSLAARLKSEVIDRKKE